MSTTLGNTLVTFGDGTTLASGNVPYTNITSPKTNLSQFTNDLGNYGPFLTGAMVDTTVYGSGSTPAIYLSWNGSQVTIVNTNCNCFCNC